MQIIDDVLHLYFGSVLHLSGGTLIQLDSVACFDKRKFEGKIFGATQQLGSPQANGSQLVSVWRCGIDCNGSTLRD
jgi:hypothetical protein